VPELAAQLEPGAVPDAPEHEPVSLAHRHDIASGRPGSTRPLSAANPRVLEHRHSVARNGDPHGDTKLSSARGLTQEREGETLAAARPGPGLRPIAFVSARTRK
jgi:hypothetical protein